jgi:aminopeptidase N
MTETTAQTPTHEAIHLADYTVPNFLIETVDLHFDIRPEATLVRATLRMARNQDGVTDAPLVLDGVGLELLRATLDGKPLSGDRFATDDTSLTVLVVPDAFELTTEVRIHPETNTSLQGLYASAACYCTQCEAEGFRHITYYLDRPDVLAKFTTTIEADRATMPVLLSNGNQTHSEAADDGRHVVKWEDPHRKPCYLFALVAGDLDHIEDHFVTSEARDVTLRIYTTTDNIDKCDHAMVSLKKSMQWDEDAFGLACDLDDYSIVVTDDFNMGAMENKGLNVFNSKYVLARPDTATDGDFAAIEGVIAHEYFHNWTGNRVTCRDWFQLSLKEGLTVFRDQQFSGDMNSRAIQRIGDVRTLRTHQFAEDAGPMAHPVRPASVIEINNFYTVTVYEKGAEVVRMYHTLLGTEGFRKGMDLYFKRFDGQAVTCDDFRRTMAEANGRDLEQFARWYSQAGTPTVAVETHYDADARTYRIELRQSCPATPGLENNQPFHMPVSVGLLDDQGEDLPLRLAGETSAGTATTTKVLELKDTDGTFVFVDVPAEPVLSLLRGLSAPVHLEYGHSVEQLAFLMANDSDAFSRFDASQKLVIGCMQRLIADHQRGEELELPTYIVSAFAAVLETYDSDPALAAELIALPSEAYLGDQMEIIDVDAVHTVRRFVRREIAVALRGPLLDIYKTCRQTGPYVFDAANVARRTVQGSCLGYLMSLEDPEIQHLCLEQYNSANNMTEVMTALVLLTHHGAPSADIALEEFHVKWGHDSLVMDKWFAIQATTPLPGALARVQALMEHAAFSMKNPNKVRSLIGAFCGQNRIHFHQADGSGYAFLADQILVLDKFNPQIASRMAGIFNHWKRFDESRGQMMRLQLQRIVDAASLSRDVYEIAAKALA